MRKRFQSDALGSHSRNVQEVTFGKLDEVLVSNLGVSSSRIWLSSWLI
jgi:hypothetical protein